MASSDWYGFDFDGTLVKYDKVFAPDKFGDPIPETIELAKKLLAEGKEVRIFTARASYSGLSEKDIEAQIAFSKAFGEELTREQAVDRIKYWNEQTDLSIRTIKDWCKEHLGQELEVTCSKDFRMAVLYDDRARHVTFNEGKVCCEH